MIPYRMPDSWIRYQPGQIIAELSDAKAAILALKSMPYQKEWVEALQKIQLKREVAGTSRIEGADFTDRELDVALSETLEQIETRSQRQARAAVFTYRWIAQIPDDRPIDAGLVCEVHRRIVTGADDDHCAPGGLRKDDENVNFGQPRHRGVEGGTQCKQAFHALLEAARTEYNGHDLLIQALALHFHLAAMHPFLDGNGRTVRALEALLLQQAGLKDSCFIAMSNYYYDEKTSYLQALSAVNRESFDLTPFLKFALKGIATQSRRLLKEIGINVQKALYRNMMFDLFTRLKSPRKRVIAERQLETLKILLSVERIRWSELRKRTGTLYEPKLKNPLKAQVRDINDLGNLRMVNISRLPDGDYDISADLEWPTQITETEFFEEVKKLPTTKAQKFLQ